MREFAGKQARISVREWPHYHARYVAVLAHGAGEHIGRYEPVAAALHQHGAAVSGADHLGHGRSGGERMGIADFDDVVADLQAVIEQAAAIHPGLPLVLIGHSMGGMIAARCAQLHGAGLAALVLSAPLLGPWPLAQMLLAMDPMPDVPIDPAVLSRDPEVGRAYADDPLVWHGGLPRVSLQATVRCLAAIDAGPDLGNLPTLWIHGGDDALVSADVVRQGLAKTGGPRLEQHLYAGARHEVFNETNRSEVLADVLGFIGRALRLG
ncbi:MAG: alpha/beta hydrolase [Ideonella sp.]|nr:alpha/beta hydrolase [Ideonella sp.]